ncbi:MAG: hypothetical protein KDN05_21340 [Verrucomicrobiae bacterium]|nr:hypothetical protein [Verrucomicrobiae bacterium]
MNNLTRSIPAVLGLACLAGCVPPPQPCGDFVMQSSWKLPSGHHTLTSPDLVTDVSPASRVFLARDLPMPVDPLSLEIAGTREIDDSDRRQPSGRVEIRAYGIPGGELLGTIDYEEGRRPERKPSAGHRAMRDFNLVVVTKEVFRPKANLRICYLMRPVQQIEVSETTDETDHTDEFRFRNP